MKDILSIDNYHLWKEDKELLSEISKRTINEQRPKTVLYNSMPIQYSTFESDENSKKNTFLCTYYKCWLCCTYNY